MFGWMRLVRWREDDGVAGEWRARLHQVINDASEDPGLQGLSLLDASSFELAVDFVVNADGKCGHVCLG